MMDFNFEQARRHWTNPNIANLPYIEPLTGLPFDTTISNALREIQNIKERLDIIERKLNEQ